MSGCTSRHLIASTAACILLAGCVGTSTVVAERKETHSVNLKAAPGELDETPGQERKYSRADVLKAWGEPRSRETKDGLEYWTYDRELAWNGIVVWMFVPIPLLAPTGHRTTTLEFQGDVLVGAIKEYGCVRFHFYQDKPQDYSDSCPAAAK